MRTHEYRYCKDGTINNSIVTAFIGKPNLAVDRNEVCLWDAPSREYSNADEHKADLDPIGVQEGDVPMISVQCSRWNQRQAACMLLIGFQEKSNNLIMWSNIIIHLFDFVMVS